MVRWIARRPIFEMVVKDKLLITLEPSFGLNGARKVYLHKEK